VMAGRIQEPAGSIKMRLTRQEGSQPDGYARDASALLPYA
jgi:hypothetical protein